MGVIGETHTEQAYLAGFFDGEGSVHSGFVMLAMENTCREIVETFQHRFGGWFAAQPARGVTYRPTYRWHVCGDKAVEAGKFLLPHLREKQPQVALMLAIAKLPHGDSQKAELFRAIKILKRIP